MHMRGVNPLNKEPISFCEEDIVLFGLCGDVQACFSGEIIANFVSGIMNMTILSHALCTNLQCLWMD